MKKFTVTMKISYLYIIPVEADDKDHAIEQVMDDPFSFAGAETFTEECVEDIECLDDRP